VNGKSDGSLFSYVYDFSFMQIYEVALLIKNLGALAMLILHFHFHDTCMTEYVVRSKVASSCLILKLERMRGQKDVLLTGLD
jgi:hypothetical protein